MLQSVPAEERVLLQQSLTFPEDSAGRLMQRELVAIPSHWTVGETIDFLRSAKDLPDDFYDLFVVDDDAQADRVGAAVARHALAAHDQARRHHGDRAAPRAGRHGPGSGRLSVPAIRPGLGAGGGRGRAG